MKIEFLPPSSPDYNPIELAFSAIKVCLRREGDFAQAAWSHSDSDVYVHLIEAMFSVTLGDACGWY